MGELRPELIPVSQRAFVGSVLRCLPFVSFLDVNCIPSFVSVAKWLNVVAGFWCSCAHRGSCLSDVLIYMVGSLFLCMCMTTSTFSVVAIILKSVVCQVGV